MLTIYRDALRAESRELSSNVQKFRDEDVKQKASLLNAGAELERTLRAAMIAQQDRNRNTQNPKSWRSRLGDGYSKFCETALHYQSIFDVLNNQAPEYTTAVRLP